MNVRPRQSGAFLTWRLTSKLARMYDRYHPRWWDNEQFTQPLLEHPGTTRSRCWRQLIAQRKGVIKL